MLEFLTHLRHCPFLNKRGMKFTMFYGDKMASQFRRIENIGLITGKEAPIYFFDRLDLILA